MTDQRVLDGLHEQLASWRAELQGGARRVGWKIGLNVPAVQQAAGIEHSVIGYLTTATLIEAGGSFSTSGSTRLVAEPEVAVEVGEDGAIAGYAAALELADIDRGFDDVQAILAGNVFHRAVVLGPAVSTLPEFSARLLVNGEERASAEAPRDVSAEVALVARLLEDAGERLQPGDRVITGSITPPQPVERGDEVTAELGSLGTLNLTLTD